MNRRTESIGAVAALSETLRRGLYDFIRAQGRPVSRDEAAEHAGISRRLAAFHLDKLTRSGLLRSHYGRPEGAARSPGRAPKLYQPTETEFEVSIPARHYDLIGQILLDAVDAVDAAGSRTGASQVDDRAADHVEVHGAEDDPDQPGSGGAGVVARQAARNRGADIGARARAGTRGGRLGPERGLRAAATVLESLGYEPVQQVREPAELCLRNCPFHRLAERSPELVCGINLAFVDGLLRGLEATGLAAVLVPAAGRCCVRVCADRAGGS